MRLPTLITKLIKENRTTCPKVQAIVTLERVGPLERPSVTWQSGDPGGTTGLWIKSQQ